MRCWLFLVLLSCIPSATALGQSEQFEGTSVTRYRKQWNDDYFNTHDEEYLAYVKSVKDAEGKEWRVEVLHGPMKDHHANGQKRIEGVYRHGRREGMFTMWAENGQKTDELPCKNGELHGRYKQWSPRGDKIREETYQRGKLEGDAVYWDTDGKEVARMTYRENKPWSGRLAEPRIEIGKSIRWVIATYKDGKLTAEEELKSPWWQ